MWNTGTLLCSSECRAGAVTGGSQGSVPPECETLAISASRLSPCPAPKVRNVSQNLLFRRPRGCKNVAPVRQPSVVQRLTCSVVARVRDIRNGFAAQRLRCSQTLRHSPFPPVPGSLSTEAQRLPNCSTCAPPASWRASPALCARHASLWGANPAPAEAQVRSCPSCRRLSESLGGVLGSLRGVLGGAGTALAAYKRRLGGSLGCLGAILAALEAM